tara:strand:- start:399 stop:824 length:426 start_codon:yes stop_codon:yes gene_type:complete
MHWIQYALLTSLALASADFFVKLASGKLSNSLAVLLYGCCTFITGLTWVLLEKAKGIPQFFQMSGFLAAIGVGISFSGVTLGLYTTFGANAPISVAVPAIRLGGVLLVSLAGIILLKEPISLEYVIGVVLVCCGMYLIIKK